MGNSFSIQNSQHLPGPDEESIRFFKSIQLKWLRTVAFQLYESSGKDFDIYDKTRLFSWREYFKIFSDIKEKIQIESDIEKSVHWHPATKNYQMLRVEDHYEQVPVVVVETKIPDDFTEDEVSDMSGNESDDNDDEEEKESEEEENEDEESEGGVDEDGNRGMKRKLKKGRESSRKSSRLDETEGSPDPESTMEDHDSDEASLKSSDSKRKSDKSDKSKTLKSQNSKVSDHSGSMSATQSRRGSKSSQLSAGSAASNIAEDVPTTPAPIKVGWNPSLVSPVFFGYSLKTISEQQEEKKQLEAHVRLQEARAVEKAKASRSTMIGTFEKSIENAKLARERHIEDLERRYEASKAKRDAELARNEKQMNPLQLGMYKKEWEADCRAAEDAHETENEDLVRIHKLKTATDMDALMKKREELEAFKDVEHQEMPAAERLEDIARIEIGRLIDIIDSQVVQMDNVRKEFTEIKEEYDLLLEKKPEAKNDIQQLGLLKSMVNMAETQVKTKQNELHASLSDLTDAEVLLQRAVRVKQQQDEILPLFRIIAGEKTPQYVRFDMFIVALLVVCSGDFDQKFHFYFELFSNQMTNPNAQNVKDLGDVDASSTAAPAVSCTSFQSAPSYADCFNAEFLCRTIEAFHETFNRLSMLSDLPDMAEIRSMMLRAFRAMNMMVTTDLTQFEVKLLLRRFFSGSFAICRALGVDPPDAMGTYQRLHMKPMTLFMMGMTDTATCRHRLHYESTRYRAALDPQRKLVVHELALSMGEDDPLQSDYSKFIQQPSKKVKSGIPPLDHGHLSNVEFVVNRVQTEAATKIQAVMRAVSERKVAELAAKYQAFQEAKEMAIQEMRDKVVKEFRKRENATGVGKMKWDAQVRMRQAKERAAQHTLSRAETVMVMMEEAVSKAKEEIEGRFKAIEAKEDFAGMDFSKKHREVVEVVHETDAFGVVAKSVVEHDDEAKISKDDTSNVEGANADGESKEGGAETETGANAEELSAAEKEELIRTGKTALVPPPKRSTMAAMSQELTVKMIRGMYTKPPQTERGETKLETEFRQSMASPEHRPTGLVARLRGIDPGFTVSKVVNFLAELPTKRLLLKMLAHNTVEDMVNELVTHFKFPRNEEFIAECLYAIRNTDMEHGILERASKDVEKHSEMGLKIMVRKDMQMAMRQLNLVLESRLMTGGGDVTEASLVGLEMDRAGFLVRKYTDSTWEIMGNIFKLKEKFRKVSLSLNEMKKRQRNVVNLVDHRLGKVIDPAVSTTERRSWMIRLMSANKLPSETLEEQRVKYAEIRCLCSEFLEDASATAQIIVNEYYLPRYDKTIYVAKEESVDGRPYVCGRGNEGKTLLYEHHNIVFRVVLDDNGVFNGSDENAAKAAGNERLGALEYFKCHIRSVNIPLIATIDYHGFRVLAVSKLPSEKYNFNDEGELRKVHEELVHGVTHKGDHYVNQGKIVSTALKSAAELLNLAPHFVKGGKDISEQEAYASSEIKAYVGYQDELYLKDFWRAFPSESPGATPHLPTAARQQSVFWRLLRPEYVKNYFENTLSPDAHCLIVLDASDRDEHIQKVNIATEALVKNTIYELAETLSNRNYSLPISQGLGLDLTLELHCRGVNMRHLGLIRYLFWRPLSCKASVFHHEKFIRTSRDLRGEVMSGDLIQINGIRYTVEETPHHKITSRKVPTKEPLDVLSEHGIDVFIGRLKSEKNCTALRSVLLGEMVARTIKQLIRLQLRQYTKRTLMTSPTYSNDLVIDYFNIVTGSAQHSDHVLQEVVYNSIRDRFGELAVQPSEKPHLQQLLRPVILYVVKRLQNMLNIHLTVSCIGEFHERPYGFVFSIMDILEIVPLVKHNIPLMAYADAELTSISAKEAKRDVYVLQVLDDAPSVFYTFYDRKGSRAAENKGTLGIDFRAIYNNSCELEESGPIITDPFSKSVRFTSSKASKVEGKYHHSISPQTVEHHFTIEAMAKCVKTKAEFGTVMMSGRFGLMVNRQGWWNFVLIEGMYEVFIKLCPVQYDEWTHIMVTYDGVIVRAYINAKEVVAVEVSAPMQAVKDDFAFEMYEKRVQLDKDEVYDKTKVQAETEAEAAAFFNTKPGAAELKRTSQAILANMEFVLENGGGDEEDFTKGAQKKRKVTAMAQAKKKYISELYIKNVQAVSLKYSIARDEITEREQRQVNEGEIRMRKPLRIGASCTSPDSGEARHFFNGYISCVVVYPACLSADRVRCHYLCGRTDKSRDAQRLYSVAAAKYAESLLFAPDDAAILTGYASSLCEYLRIENTGSSAQGISIGKLKVLEAIEEFKTMLAANGIAEIINHIPKECEYANLVCAGINAIMDVDKGFFTRGKAMSRADLVSLPRTFALDHPTNTPFFIDTAARIYQEVVKDVSLSFAYGDMKLDWLTDLKCSELIVALIKHAYEDASLDIVRIGEIFKASLRESINITDEDVLVLAGNLLTAIGFDFSGCKLLSNDSISYMCRVKTLKILTLDGCVEITDSGLKYLDLLADQLEVLSLAGLTHISDDGLDQIGLKSGVLRILNVNNCPNVTHNILILFAKKNKALSTLHASATYITDDGMTQLCNHLSEKHMTSLDISFCRAVTDYSIVSLAQACPNLLTINLCGLSRVTTQSMKSIMSKCWYLKTINLEDMFLVTDEVFFFDREGDGRPQAEAAYLRQLKNINLRDCVNLTDAGFQVICDRCRKVESITLRGCDKLTNESIRRMFYLNPISGPTSFAATLHVLDISFCHNFTADVILELLGQGLGIEELNVSGTTTVNDEFIEEMCKLCPTINKLSVARCPFITDAALCSMADYLWVEELDISYCNKITDDSIEVLTTACTGLTKFCARKVFRLSPNAITAIARNCNVIREVDVRECDQINDMSLSDLHNHQKFVKIQH